MLPGPTCVVFVCPCLAKGGANTGLAMAQEEFEAWRLGTQDSSLIPRTPLAQSVVLETGPQPTPSTAIFASTPASLRRASYHRSCQAEELVPTVEWGVRAWTLHPCSPAPIWNT